MSDGLGRLWAGWRGAYLRAVIEADRSGTTGDYPTAEGVDDAIVADDQVSSCVLCRVTAPGLDAEEANVVWRGAHCAAILNAYPYATGHVMVLPTRHTGELEDLRVAEAAELWDAVRRAVVALKAAYRPDGINLGVNLGRAAGAGVPGHLHVHGVPRWEADTNFMTSTAGTRVLPEPLPETWSRVRAAWPAA